MTSSRFHIGTNDQNHPMMFPTASLALLPESLISCPWESNLHSPPLHASLGKPKPLNTGIGLGVEYASSSYRDSSLDTLILQLRPPAVWAFYPNTVPELCFPEYLRVELSKSRREVQGGLWHSAPGPLWVLTKHVPLHSSRSVLVSCGSLWKGHTHTQTCILHTCRHVPHTHRHAHYTCTCRRADYTHADIHVIHIHSSSKLLLNQMWRIQ